MFTIDAAFFVDIIVTFFTAYHDESKINLVTDKKVIAKKYIKFWFWLDLLSILPVDMFISSSDENGSLSGVTRFSKMGRLYKMVRMLRMVKMIRLIKDRKKIINNLDSLINVNDSMEKYMLLVLAFILCNHVLTCIWIMLASFDELYNWRLAFRDKFTDFEDYSFVDDYGDGDWYLVGIYFIATTVTTVGYGDLNPVNNIERGFCSVLMFIGVIGFSFATGALGSLIASQETAQAKLQEKLMLLTKIRRQFKLSDKLYKDISVAIKYEYSKNIDGLGDFMDRLPQKLKISMAKEIHKDLSQTITFFERQPEPQFLSWVGHRLTPRIIQEEQYLYQETEPIQEVFFLLHGNVAYVLPRYNNATYNNAQEGDIVGFEDVIYNDQLLGNGPHDLQ